MLKARLWVAALGLSALSFAHADMAGTIGQVAGAMYGNGTNNGALGNVASAVLGSNAGQSMAGNVLGSVAGSVASGMLNGNNNAPANTTQLPALYSTDQLKNMSCLDLELTSSRLDRAIALSRSNATDLNEQEKAANSNASTSQLRKYGAIAAVLGEVGAAQGGRAAQYGKIAQQMGGIGSTNSQALDVEINNLQKLNDQAADVAIIRRSKGCTEAARPLTTSMPAPVQTTQSTTSTTTTTVATGAAATGLLPTNTASASKAKTTKKTAKKPVKKVVKKASN